MAQTNTKMIKYHCLVSGEL